LRKSAIARLRSSLNMVSPIVRLLNVLLALLVPDPSALNAIWLTPNPVHRD
jgi:hypothetical protein